MSRSVRKALLLTGLVAVAVGPGAADAAARATSSSAAGAARPPASARLAPMAGDERVSLDEAIRMVRERYGDVTILKARTKGRSGTRTHTIKFLTKSGRVRTVRVDADSGEMR
jgi:uncharacterized membrane protein YkoI